MNLHRWQTFKSEFEQDTVAMQANVDHCGSCGLTPIAQAKPLMPIAKPAHVSYQPFPKHFRRSFLGVSLVLAAGVAMWSTSSAATKCRPFKSRNSAGRIALQEVNQFK